MYQVVLAVVSPVVVPEGSAVVFAVAVQYSKLSFWPKRRTPPRCPILRSWN